MDNHIILTGFVDEISDNFDEQIKGAVRNGLSQIEIRGIDGKNISDCTKEEVKLAKSKLDAAGLCVSSIGSPIGKIEITDPFNEHFEQFKKIVEYAKLFDTPYIRMFSFYIPDGEDKYAYEEEVMQRLGVMVDYAAAQDVILLHENEKKIFGDDAAGCVKIMERFYGEHFKCIFDFANFVECDQDTMEAYELLKPYIYYIHVKDAKKDTKQVVPAGMGDGNVREILSLLKKSGFSGHLSLEPHLANFTGLAKLEEEDALKKRVFADKSLAFDLAVRSLKAILWEIQWY